MIKLCSSGILLSSLLLSGCGEDLGVSTPTAASENSIAGDVPFAYVQRTLSDNSTATTAALAYRSGARLMVRDRVSSSANDSEILAAAIGSSDYDVKDLNVSPDGQLLIFAARTATTTWNLYEYDFSAASVRRIISDDSTANAGHDFSPAYTTAGDIIFASTRPAGMSESSHAVLYKMSRNGDELQQLTSGDVYDYRPTPLADGGVIFIRITAGAETSVCDSTVSAMATGLSASTCTSSSSQTAASKEYSLMKMTAYNAEPELLASGDIPSGSAEAGLDLMNLVQDTDGHLEALIRHQQHSLQGGDVIKLAAGNGENTVYANLGPASSTGGSVNIYPQQISDGGWYSAFWPYRDGSGRMLVSWTQCLAQQGGLTSSCKDSTSFDNVSAHYGVWAYDPSANTRQPVITGKAGVIYTELALAYPYQASALNFNPVAPGKEDPTDPGTTDPTNPGTTDPTDPGTTDPTNPGTTDPTDPGTTDPTDPTDPGTTDPTDPGTTDPTDPGTSEPTGAAINASISTLEDVAVALNIDMSAYKEWTDAGSMGDLLITDVPAAASFNTGVRNGDGSWTIPLAQLAQLQFVPAADSGVDALMKTAVVFTAGGKSKTFSGSIQVSVQAVADQPQLTFSQQALPADRFISAYPQDNRAVVNIDDVVSQLNSSNYVLVATSQARGDIQTGAENNWIVASNASVSASAGDDVIQVNEGSADAGEGNDIVQLVRGSVNGGAGNDLIQINAGSVNGGAGDDVIQIKEWADAVNTDIDGGDGFDHLLVNQALVSHIESTAEGSGRIDFINGGSVTYHNIENLSRTGDIVFAQGVRLTLAAALTDTDGSESLLSTVISGVPEGALLTHATRTAAGVWQLDAGYQGDADLIWPASQQDNFTLTMTVSSQDSDADTGALYPLSSNSSITVTVASLLDPTDPLTPAEPGTTDPTDPTDPTNPGTDPTDPGTDPTDPGTDPTDPGTDPTNPGTDPTDPGTDPTDPGTDPTDPGTDPTDPGTDPTDPGTDPTDPGTDPTDPGTDPTDPGTDPTDPGTDPNDPETPTTGACYKGQGYWKTHNVYASNASQQIAWPVIGSGVTEDTAMCSQTWLENLNTQPLGNAFVILSHQWIAARLNQANGAEIPTTIASALNRGAELLAQCQISYAQREEAVELAGLLDDFNNDEDCDYAEPQQPITSHYGVVDIRSIYEANGLDMAAARGGISALADPSLNPMDNRSERFIRVTAVNDGQPELIGYADVQPDGSALFKVPANTRFTLEVVNARLKAIASKGDDYHYLAQLSSSTHQVAAGDMLELQAGSLLNPGAAAAGAAFTHANPDILASAAGQTMAEALADYQQQVMAASAEVQYTDHWSTTSPSADIHYSYSQLETAAPANAACVNSWDIDCRARAGYLQNIQPLWEKAGRDGDGRSCVACHDNSGATSLDLTWDGSSLTKTTVKSFSELFAARSTWLYLSNNFSEIAASHCRRVEELPYPEQPGNDCFTCYSRYLMSEDGALESANFFELFATDADHGLYLFAPGDTPRVNHSGMLNREELRMISEWLDNGAPL